MCFVHKHMQNADFGQILSRRASTKSRVTSRPMIQFSQTWCQKMRKTWKKKVMKRRVAISSGRDAVADFVQGGQIDPPPPPVKIGLTLAFCHRSICHWSNSRRSTCHTFVTVPCKVINGESACILQCKLCTWCGHISINGKYGVLPIQTSLHCNLNYKGIVQCHTVIWQLLP